MKKIKKDNSGFSLVELIVVILIMAIISVTMTMQILKWIRNARIADDLQLKGNLVTFMQITVLADEAANELAKKNGAIITINNDPDTSTFTAADGTPITSGALYEKFMSCAGISRLSELELKTPDTRIVVNVSKDGASISSHYYDISGATSVELDIDN